MPERNIEALEQLRRVVEAAPEERLDMRKWCGKSACGTTYCAAGWAAIDPWFQRNTDILDTFDVREGTTRDGVLTTLVGHRRGAGMASKALARIFGIRWREAVFLFGLNLDNDHLPSDVTKAEVLERIDALIAGDDIGPYEAIFKD